MIKNWLAIWRVILLTPYYLVLYLGIPILFVSGFVTIGYTWRGLKPIIKTLNNVDDIVFGIFN
jgi:hypothetical protein